MVQMTEKVYCLQLGICRNDYCSVMLKKLLKNGIKGCSGVAYQQVNIRFFIHIKALSDLLYFK